MSNVGFVWRLVAQIHSDSTAVNFRNGYQTGCPLEAVSGPNSPMMM